MSTRELTNPAIEVRRDPHDERLILIRLHVAGSRFGPVLVRLTELEAAQLARDVWAEVPV